MDEPLEFELADDARKIACPRPVGKTRANAVRRHGCRLNARLSPYYCANS
jgi:hypothetical protein